MTAITLALEWEPNANHVGGPELLPRPIPPAACMQARPGHACLLRDLPHTASAERNVELVLAGRSCNACPVVTAGFYVAREKGWYGEAGLEVALAVPDNAYSTTPASKVAAPPDLMYHIRPRRLQNDAAPRRKHQTERAAMQR